jgi:hypothetical protein
MPTTRASSLLTNGQNKNLTLCEKTTLVSSQAFKAWKIYCASLQWTLRKSIVQVYSGLCLSPQYTCTRVVNPTKFRSGNHVKPTPGSGTKYGYQTQGY